MGSRIEVKTDTIFKGIVASLLIVGFFILASASIGLTASMKAPSYYFILRQITMGGAVGLALFIFAAKFPYKKWKKWALVIFAGSILLTSAVWIPGLGLKVGGASRWLIFGPLSLQPSEFLKFGLILYLAAWFSSRGGKISSVNGGLIPFLIIMSVASSLLVFQPDIGTLGVLAISGLFLFLIAGGKFTHILILILIGLIFLGILIYLEPYRQDRLTVFLNPDHDPQGSGYQVRQALIAIGSGGLWGRGFGMSRQKFQYLPEPVGDSIFAVAAEEFGFIGASVIISLFLLLAWRGFYISRFAPDTFGKLLGSGMVLLMAVQSMINISALAGLTPLTGIPLIFISQGGSSLAVTLLEAGVLLNISKSN